MKVAVAGLVTLTAWLSGFATALPSSSSESLKNFFPRQTLQQQQEQDTFNPLANDVLAVYYGKAFYNSYPSMYDLCHDDDIDVVVMGFVRQMNGAYMQPTFDIGACKTPSSTPANFTGIKCPDLAANITYCQSVGKKVMMSLGGSSSNLSVYSAEEAQQVATTLWNVFGAGTATPTLRPFGNVSVDGFDFDIEGGTTPDYMDIMASTMQSLFQTSSPTRYISTAPLCANNTVLPYDFYKSANFVWPRFYNARACGVGSKGYNNSVTTWTNFLTGVESNIGAHYPRFYIAALGFENYNSGYMAPDAFGDVVEYTKDLVGKERFGGVAIWEGTDALITKSQDGRDFLNVTKEALLEPFTSDACGRLDGRVLGVLKLIRGQIDRLGRRGRGSSNRVVYSRRGR